MRRLLSILVIATVSFSCARGALPYLDIASDVQKPDEEFYIKRVYSGNTPLIRWTANDSSVTNGVADLSGWSFTLWYAADNSATSGWFVSQTSITSNKVVFSSITNFWAIPNDNYYVTIYGTHSSGYIQTWGVGRMNQKWDFVAGQPYTNTTGILGTTQLNWSVFSSYIGAWPFFAGTNVVLNTTTTGLIINAFTTNGINGATTGSAATGAVELATNWITVKFPTERTVFTGNVRAASSTGIALLNSSGSTTALFGVGGGLSAMFMDGASFAGQISGNGSGITNVLDVTNRVLASTGISVTNANGKAYISLTSGASNGLNNVLTASGATNGVSLTTNTLTVTFATNVTGGYSTSALLTVTRDGTNIIGGLSSAIATGNQWNASLANYLPLAGGTITGEMYFVDTGGQATIVDGAIVGNSFSTTQNEATVTVNGFTGNGANITNLSPAQLNAATSFVRNTGDTMTGPITNAYGYYGNGVGLTNLTANPSWPFVSNDSVYVSSLPLTIGAGSTATFTRANTAWPVTLTQTSATTLVIDSTLYSTNGALFKVELNPASFSTAVLSTQIVNWTTGTFLSTSAVNSIYFIQPAGVSTWHVRQEW